MNFRHSHLCAAWALAACVLTATPARADQEPAASPFRPASKSSNLLRFFAVGGTLGSWALAGWQEAPLTRCDGARWQVRGQWGRDDELAQTSAGAAWGDCQMLRLGGWSLSHQTALTAGHWRAHGQFGGADAAWDVALVPLLHWQHHAFGPHMMEFEFGVGPAWLSEPHIGDRYKSTQFQFSDHLGVNLVGPADRWRVGLHWRHISNLDIRTPNNGVDFTGLVLAWSL